MTSDLLHDRGRGPELIGTRITVYNLLPYFLDPTATEDYICRVYELSPEQVAAARAYVLNHPDTVLARHLEIEERIAIGNPPEVREEALKIREVFQAFREWIVQRDAAEAAEDARQAAEGVELDPERFPTFREWFERSGSPPAERP